MARLNSRLALVSLAFFVAFVLVAPLPAGASPAAASSAGALLPPAGGWVAYGFYYNGDNSKVGITLTFSPVDSATEHTGAVTLELFSPSNPPPNGKAIAQASRTGSGRQYLEFSSDVAGRYVIVVHNWDPSKRHLSVQVSLTFVDRNVPAPGLEFISASAGVLPGAGGLRVPPIPGVPAGVSLPVVASSGSFPLPGGGTATYNITPVEGGKAHVKFTIRRPNRAASTFEFDTPATGPIDPRGLLPSIPWWR